jgi:hypothetical protein
MNGSSRLGYTKNWVECEQLVFNRCKWPLVQNLIVYTDKYLEDSTSKNSYFFVDDLKILYKILIMLQ